MLCRKNKHLFELSSKNMGFLDVLTRPKRPLILQNVPLIL